MQSKIDQGEWVPLSDAASMAGRSYAWARDRAATGVFDRHPSGGRRILVSTQSVRAAIIRDQSRTPEGGKGRGARRALRGKIRLIIDNTK